MFELCALVLMILEPCHTSKSVRRHDHTLIFFPAVYEEPLAIYPFTPHVCSMLSLYLPFSLPLLLPCTSFVIVCAGGLG